MALRDPVTQRGSRLVGSRIPVPLVTGGTAEYVDLDVAATAPPLHEVVEAVEGFLPWYGSAHRGSGYRSIVATRTYEAAREVVRDFLNAPADHVVIFTRNTTDSINLLASALPSGTAVITFDGEHHANLLPWRLTEVRHLPCPPEPSLVAPMVEREVSEIRSEDPERPVLVAVTAASNVTGEIWPVKEIAAAAHTAGARVFVDAAQAAPHIPLDLLDLGVDYLAFSGHKLYAPFGSGALIGAADRLERSDPYLRGGGAVRFVTMDDVV